MVSEQFRRQLRQEAEQWRQEALINDAVYAQLTERYRFDEIESFARNRFVAIMIGVGCILLGLGVITFVAANWQAWSRWGRVLVLMATFIGVNAAGFYLWRRPANQKGLQRLGHGLLLAGALCLGANMALMSQMFHQSGEIHELYLAWSLGVVVMAYSLRLSSLGILAWILMAMGYSSRLFVNAGWDGSLIESSAVSGTFHLMFENMALFGVALFLPLAYYCRSRIIFCLVGVAFPPVLMLELFKFVSISGEMVALSVVLPPALLWAHDQNLYRSLWHSMTTWRHPRSLTVTKDPFQGIARALAVLLLSILLYTYSFHWLWESWETQSGLQLPLLSALYLLIFVIVALLSWAYLIGRRRSSQGLSVNTVSFASVLVVLTGLIYCHAVIKHLPKLAPIVINGMMFGLAIALIRDGLAMGHRRTAWGGLILLTVGILSRTFEYNTDLLFKAFVFAVCGVGVILCGLWFERRLHRKTGTLSPRSLPE